MTRLPVVNLGPKNLYERCMSWTEANMYNAVSDFNKEFNQKVTGNPRSFLKAAVELKDKKNDLLLRILKGVHTGRISYSDGLKQVQLLSNAKIKEAMNFLRLREFLPQEGKKENIIESYLKEVTDSLELKPIKKEFESLT